MPESPAQNSAVAAPKAPSGLAIVRFILVTTAIALVAPIVDLGADIIVTLMFALAIPLPCYLALGLLWKGAHLPRVRAGLALSRAIGFTHALLFLLLAYEALFVSWPTHYDFVAILAVLFALQVTLIALSWYSLRLRTLSESEAQAGRERFFKFLGQAVLTLFVIAYLAAPPVGFSGHALSRRENVAISQLRTFVSAQAAYASSNGGFFGLPECLPEPTRCLPDYPKTGPIFVDATSLAGRSYGYVFTFRPGRAPSAEELQKAKGAPGSIATWAYYAVPEAPGRSGYRSFCMDENGVMRQTVDRTVPDTSQPVCPSSMPVVM